MKPKIAVSVGDLNGVGLEIALASHNTISEFCRPVYCINTSLLEQAQKLLKIFLENLTLSEVEGEFEITPGKLSKEAGQYSFKSFLRGVELAKNKEVDAVVTMPIHKEAWALAGVDFKGHTDMLRSYFKKDAIMMLGTPKMFVALYSEHIPLKEVASSIKKERLVAFFRDFLQNVGEQKVAVLGLNPHAGDNGVLGNEEQEITKAIELINKEFNQELLVGPIVPDVAFTPNFRKNFNYFIAMYHDQGLAPLKALYFDESVNISLNLPIIRTSVDHGTAFDIAYKGKANNLSYINAIKSAITFMK